MAVARSNCSQIKVESYSCNQRLKRDRSQMNQQHKMSNIRPCAEGGGVVPDDRKSAKESLR